MTDRKSISAGSPTLPVVKLSPFMNTVDEYVCAGYQSLSINTTELHRVEEELYMLPDLCQYEAVLTWDCVDGIRVRSVCKTAPLKMRELLNKTLDVPTKGAGTNNPQRVPTTNPLTALKYVLDPTEFPFNNCLIVFRNLHAPLAQDLAVAQLWQTAVSERHFNMEIDDPRARNNDDIPTAVVRRRIPIVIGTATQFSASIRPTITPVEFSLPKLKYMRQIFDDLDDAVREQSPVALPDKNSPECVALTESATRLLLGLSSTEASDALALCAVRHGNLCDPVILDTIEHQKVEILKGATSLEYVKRSAIGTEADIGGFQDFVPWIKERRVCYTQAGLDKELDAPKGVVIIGVPGTAKSLVAKISSRVLNLPMVKMDVGAIFGSLVGQSEQRMADTIRTIEAMCGAVVLIDEADKLWGGAADASGDSGVTRRVFGKFLSWMADKKDGSFVIMTVNRTKGLPPEFLRRGRFDEIWYTDIPNVTEREQILGIHMRLRKLDMATILANDKDKDDVLDAMTDFVGAEIEAVVVQARLTAFAAHGGDPTAADLMKAATTIIPLMKLDGENIQQIRDFCKDSARPVQPRLVEAAPAALTGGKRAVSSRKVNATS